MLTRRQKNSLRGLTAALTSVALLSGFLIYTNISNAEKTTPVVISDILEGAVAYSDDEEQPAVTLSSDLLMETMFSEQYETFTLPSDPALTVTYIPPEAAFPEDTRLYSFEITVSTDDTTDKPEPQITDVTLIMPDNPNEVTLLSDDLNALTSPAETTAATTTTTASTATSVSDTKPVSSRSESSATTSVSTTYITYSGTTTATFAVSTTSKQTSATTVSSVTTKPAVTSTTAATAATTTPKTTPYTSKTPFTNVGGGSFSTDDNVYLTMLKLVNNARREAGLNELWYSARVHEVCELRADELTSYYSHNRPDGTRFSTAFKDIGISYNKCGENIAYGRNMFSTAEEVFKAWMESDSHRENILSPDFECCAFGLSVLKVGNDTYYYWAQEFAKF